jgi:hypothetical protein
MALFMHPSLMDQEPELAMTTGCTVIVTEDGCEVLSRLALDLVVTYQRRGPGPLRPAGGDAAAGVDLGIMRFMPRRRAA